jgi:hypothetical protein
VAGKERGLVGFQIGTKNGGIGTEHGILSVAGWMVLLTPELVTD